MQAFPSRAPAAAPDDTYRPDLNVRLMCPDCKENGQLIEQFASGDLVCGNCGIVLGDRVVDTRSEWRTFADSDGDDPSRVGGPGDPLLSGASQLSSLISYRDNHTGIARSLQRASASQDKKSGEKLLVTAFNEIQHMCDQISLPRTVCDSAKQLFKRQDEEKLLKAKPLNAICATCIFIACREQHVERSFKEIVALSGVPKLDIAKCYKKMSQAFGATSASNPSGGSGTSAASAAGLVARFCNHLGLPPAVQSATSEVVRNIDEFGILAGRSPLSVASACVYFTSHAFGLGKSIKEITPIAGVSDSTLRLCYKLAFS